MRRRSKSVFVSLSIALPILFVGCIGSTSEQEPAADVKPKPSSKVPTSESFTSDQTVVPTTVPTTVPKTVVLKTVDEKQFVQVLENHRGRVILVDFWAIWCSECVELLPHSAQLQQRFKEKGLTVITVNCDDPEERADVLDVLRKKCANLENYTTPYSPIVATGAFKIDDDALPHFRLYDRNGTLRRKFVVDIEPWTVESLDEAVEALLEEP